MPGRWQTMTVARQAGAELIAFPEVVLDPFFPQYRGDEKALSLAEPIPGPTTERIAERAAELGLVTIFTSTSSTSTAAVSTARR